MDREENCGQKGGGRAEGRGTNRDNSTEFSGTRVSRLVDNNALRARPSPYPYVYFHCFILITLTKM